MPAGRRIALGKRVLYSLIPVTLLVMGMEGVLRVAGFEFSPWHLGQSQLVPDGPGRVKTRPQFTREAPYGFAICRDVRATAEKPAGTLRVVLLGESSVYRLGDADLLSRRVSDRLARPVEVVNLGFQGCGSERTVLSAREGLALNPDVLAIYVGHNEFVSFSNPATRLEERGLLDLPNPAPLRILQLAQLIDAWAVQPRVERLAASERTYIAGEKEAFYTAFRERLASILQEARERGVAVVVGSVAVNYEIPPRRALEHVAYEDVGGMPANELEFLLVSHGDDSFLEYARGRRAAESGDWVAAKAWIDKSFDHDARPIRASPAINRIIREVAQMESAVLADVELAVGLAASNHGLPGMDLFEDHCHLNAAGNAILEETFADAILSAVKRPPASGP
jgi:lysophospholipase L1-like esterase